MLFEDKARFYIAGVALGLSHLHSKCATVSRWGSGEPLRIELWQVFRSELDIDRVYHHSSYVIRLVSSNMLVDSQNSCRVGGVECLYQSVVLSQACHLARSQTGELPNGWEGQHKPGHRDTATWWWMIRLVGSVQSRLAISKRKEPACRQSPSRANTAGIFEDHWLWHFEDASLSFTSGKGS